MKVLRRDNLKCALLSVVYVVYDDLLFTPPVSAAIRKNYQHFLCTMRSDHMPFEPALFKHILTLHISESANKSPSTRSL